MVNESNLQFSSGIPSLDDLLQGILPRDNVVFQIDEVEDYIPFVKAFSEYCNEKNLDLVYFRFADHEELLPPSTKASVYILYPEKGFEYFISDIIRIVEKHGIGYIFDSLSAIALGWYSDIMLGNFFMLVRPLLYELKTAAYFGLFRHYLYLVIYSEKNDYINQNNFKDAKNSLIELIPDTDRWADTVKVIELNSDQQIVNAYLNSFKQEGICYLKKNL